MTAPVAPPAKRRRSPLVFLPLYVAIGGGVWFLYSRLGYGGAGITIPIPQAVIQKSVEAQFPMKEGRIELRDPEIVLPAGGDRIGMRMEVRAPMIATTATVEADGQIRYDRDSASFFMDNPHLNEMHAHGLLGGVMNAARKPVDVALKNLLPKVCVYQLDNTWQSRVAKATLRKVSVENGQLMVTLGGVQQK